MGAFGNYEIVTEGFDFASPHGQSVSVDVPNGKVALGWGVKNVLVYDPGNTPTGSWNPDLIVTGYPTTDGSSVTFVFTQTQSEAGVRSTGTLYVTCAEMGC